MAEKSKVIRVEVEWAGKPIGVHFTRHVEKPIVLNRHMMKNSYRLSSSSYKRLVPFLHKAHGQTFHTLVGFNLIDNDKVSYLNDVIRTHKG